MQAGEIDGQALQHLCLLLPSADTAALQTALDIFDLDQALHCVRALAQSLPPTPHHLRNTADAYGERRDGLTQRVPKKHFGNQRLVPGQQVVLQTNFGPRAVTIQKVGMSVVDVDLNHPMAGKDLHFDVEIVDVREASPEEIEHGHVHGEGGHHH